MEPDRQAITHTTDHVAGGLALLTSQFRGKPAIAAVLSSWLAGVQDVEDAIWQLLTQTIDTGVGDPLDQLGEVLGQARKGLSDALYRAVLHATAKAVRASGVGDELVLIAIELGTNTDIRVAEVFPAGVEVEPVAAPDIPAAVILTVLRRAVSAGVRLQVFDVPTGDTFAFASTDGDETDSARGFSDTTEAPGGRWMGVLE
mgnify:CR=1 FL=1